MKHIDKMKKERFALLKPQMRLWILLITLVSSGFVSAQSGAPDPGWIGGVS